MCLDAIASAPLLSLVSKRKQVNLLHLYSLVHHEYNAHQIFNCQRTEKLSRFYAQLSIYYSDCLLEWLMESCELL